MSYRKGGGKTRSYMQRLKVGHSKRQTPYSVKLNKKTPTPEIGGGGNSIIKEAGGVVSQLSQSIEPMLNGYFTFTAINQGITAIQDAAERFHQNTISRGLETQAKTKALLDSAAEDVRSLADETADGGGFGEGEAWKFVSNTQS